MTKTTTLLLCARCHQSFECKPHDISNCHCSTVALSDEELKFIASQYSNCICNTCLLTLKANFFKIGIAHFKSSRQ
ncbi:MAG: cysteine-rich CWC family protein [Bacteroidia bacterium]|nr:cysteine-rich CWC family protein [Bacteroidia bacterium]